MGVVDSVGVDSEYDFNSDYFQHFCTVITVYENSYGKWIKLFKVIMITNVCNYKEYLQKSFAQYALQALNTLKRIKAEKAGWIIVTLVLLP